MSLKIKRNLTLLLVLVLVLSFLVMALGDQRIIAYTVKAADLDSASVNVTAVNVTASSILNDTDLFDDSLVHTIQVIMSDEDYQNMITTYQATGLKEYYHADILIDGVRVNNVGIRLKGNASLRTALGGMGGGMRFGNRGQGEDFQPQVGEEGAVPAFPGRGDLFQVPAEGERPVPPQGMELPEGVERPQMPEGGGVVQQPENRAFPGGGQLPQDNLQTTQPGSGDVKIPFLIKFDEFEDGQNYQGYTSIAIRTYGATYDEAMLEEPITNAMARLVDLPATRTAYSGFSLNDLPEELYVISEILDEEYLAANVENPGGVLYKAELGSTLSYKGDNPSAYASSFSQVTRENDADLLPLIDFIRFVNQSDDATFESELPSYLDVDAFATYLALNNLLVNTDTIFGMNNNYYLCYDEATRKFTLLMWDGNESLGGLGGGTITNYDVSFSSTQGMRSGGFGGGQNVLFKRFIANPTFKALYEQKLQEIYPQIFTSGAIQEQVERYSALIHAVNDDRSLVDLAAYDQAVQNVLDFISQRMNYLSSLE